MKRRIKEERQKGADQHRGHPQMWFLCLNNKFDLVHLVSENKREKRQCVMQMAHRMVVRKNQVFMNEIPDYQIVRLPRGSCTRNLNPILSNDWGLDARPRATNCAMLHSSRWHSCDTLPQLGGSALKKQCNLHKVTWLQRSQLTSTHQSFISPASIFQSRGNQGVPSSLRNWSDPGTFTLLVTGWFWAECH